MGLSWHNVVPNNEPMGTAAMHQTSEIARIRRLTFAGYVLRLPEKVPANKAIELDASIRRKNRERNAEYFADDIHIQDVQHC